MARKVLWVSIILVLLAVNAAFARRDRWIVGGEERPWGAWEETTLTMDDWSVPGAIQPRDFRPEENIAPIVLPPEEQTGYGSSGAPLIDGDWETYIPHVQRGARYIGRYFTFDLGVAVPANRVVFGPPQTGLDVYGNPHVENPMKGYQFSAAREQPEWYGKERYPYGAQWHEIYAFEDLLIHQDENLESIVELDFPTQYIRFFRLMNIVDVPYEIAEIQIHGDGFVSKAIYTSKIIDLGDVANLGTIHWDAATLRKNQEGTLEAAPDAKVRVSVETRGGADETPMIYYEYTQTHRLRVVDQATWERLRPYTPGGLILPRMQGPVAYDEAHWSHWSLPYTASGTRVEASGLKRYVQFRITIETDSYIETARMDSLWFSYSSPSLAGSVIGEVALLDDPDPVDGTPTVVVGEPVVFSYDLSARFTSSRQVGFDSLVVDVPSKARFKALQIGDEGGLIPVASEEAMFGPSVYRDLVTGDSIFVKEDASDQLALYFPKRSFRLGSWTRLRLVFETALLAYGAQFTASVYQSGTEEFSQPVEPGDANAEVATNHLKVIAHEMSREVIIYDAQVLPEIMTPNGDGVNDEAMFSYHLLRIVDPVRVCIQIYDLLGRRIKTVYEGSETQGVYHEESGPYRGKIWDGSGDDGTKVPPGVYLWRIRVETDAGTSAESGTLSVVY